MNINEAFKTLGLEPVTDFKMIKDVYREQYKKLQRSIAKARAKGSDITKQEDKLQKLNQAINYFEVRKNSLEDEVVKAKYTEEQGKDYIAAFGEELGKQMIEAKLGEMNLSKSNPNTNFMESIKRSIKIGWKEMDIPVEADEVTLGVYLRGGNIMVKEEMVEIPKGFEGVYVRTLKGGDLQFISIKIKTSATFELKQDGDLILKNIPSKYEKLKDGIAFTFSATDFTLDKSSELESKSDKGIKVYTTDIYKYGTKETIKVEVHPNTEVYNLCYK